MVCLWRYMNTDSTSPHNQVKIGVGVMVLKDRKVLFAKRISSHGAGEYSFPGGHLEYMEGFEECALREIKEECGITVKNLRFHFVANVTTYAPKHYAHIGMIADWQSGEPQILEPERAESWAWYDMDALPSPLFEMCRLAIKAYKENITYFDKQ